MGPHWLDVFRFLFGEPQSIYARLHRASPHVQGEDVALLVLGYQNLTCTIENSWASVQIPGIDDLPGGGAGASAPRLEIEGTEATLSLTCDGTLHLYSEAGHHAWRYREDERPHVRRSQHFVDCPRPAPSSGSGAAMLNTMALVHSAYLSTAFRVIDVAELLPLQRQPYHRPYERTPEHRKILR